MTWSLILIPLTPRLWQKCKKGRRVVLSLFSYYVLYGWCYPSHRPHNIWKSISLFVPLKKWNFIRYWESESVGSYCVRTSPSWSSNQEISTSEQFQVSQSRSSLFLWKQIFYFSNRKLLSISTQFYFLSVSVTVQSEGCVMQLPLRHSLEAHQGFFP